MLTRNEAMRKKIRRIYVFSHENEILEEAFCNASLENHLLGMLRSNERGSRN
jgi:hypothetical protein